MARGNLEHDVTTNAAPAGAQLKSLFERIERLSEEKKSLSEDIRDVFLEAKSNGFDPKIMRIILKRRAMNAAERAEQDALVETYSHAIGMASPADPEADNDDE